MQYENQLANKYDKSEINCFLGFNHCCRINSCNIIWDFINRWFKKLSVQTIHGEKVIIYGKKLYRADFSIQEIVQDYIRLYLGITLFLILRSVARKKSLLGPTFFAFIPTVLEIDLNEIKNRFTSEKFVRNGGVFLMISTMMVGLLWLGAIIPPIFNDSFYSRELQNYTPLIFQGFDLGLLLPIAFVVLILAIRKCRFGFLFTPIYMIFLSLIMIALVSKIIFMTDAGQNVISIILIMPNIVLISRVLSVLLLENTNENNYSLLEQ